MSITSAEIKKILIICDWYEPGFKAGGPIQSVRNIVHALKDSFRFYIFTSDRDLGENTPYPGITTDCWQQIDQNIQVWYATPSAVTGKQYNDIVFSIGPDVVYFNSMFSSKFTLLPLRALMRNGFAGKIILAPRGMLHKGALKQKALKKNIFLLFFRFAGWHKKIIFHATDEQERKDILTWFPGHAAVTVAGNIPHFNEQPWKQRKKEKQHLHCIYVSRIHPKKGLHYFLEILNGIDNRLEVTFDIYGEEDDKEYSSRCRQLASSLRKGISTRFAGPLPHAQVVPVLEQGHLFVLPTLGENFGHAVFEALSAGCPVLISDQTPWHNMEQKKAGWDIPLNAQGKFKEALEQAAGFDQEEFNSWSNSAYQYATGYLKQTDLAKTYIKLFKEDVYFRN